MDGVKARDSAQSSASLTHYKLKWLLLDLTLSRSVLPVLKGVIYQITCARCTSIHQRAPSS